MKGSAGSLIIWLPFLASPALPHILSLFWAHCPGHSFLKALFTLLYFILAVPVAQNTLGSWHRRSYLPRLCSSVPSSLCSRPPHSY